MANRKAQEKNVQDEANLEENINPEETKNETKKVTNIDKASEYIAKLNEDLEEQKRLADEYYDSLKRNMADFDNYKKRMTKEKESLHTMVVADIVEDLLPILDNFENALTHECTDDKFKTGMDMIYNQIKVAISKYGVEEIECIGKEFDPMLHEAVMHIDDENFGEKEVTEVFRKGYKIKEKVIRHAMVKVAN